MKITIIGASAGIGLQTVTQALARGHQVTTLSRSINTLPDHPALTVIKGTATAAADIKKATTDAEAVIVTIGIVKDKVPTLFTETAQALMNTISYNIPVIIVTAFGVGESRHYGNWLMKLIFQTILKKEFADKSRMEKLVAKSKLQWIIARPGMLTNGPFTGRYRILTELQKGIKSIARADVADFLLNQAEHPTLLYKHVLLTK